MTLSNEELQQIAADGFIKHGDAKVMARELLERRERDKRESDIGEIRVGRLPTMNQDEYPGLGDWWVQLRIGEDSEEVLARVYGSTPQEANNRAYALACRAAMHASTISNSADIAIDEGGQSFGNSEQLNSPVWVGVDWAEGCKPSNSSVAPDGWISVYDQMPDPKSERRVCVFTPTPHEDMRYRFVPASLFKAVCSSATHWYYIEPPSAPKQEPNQ